MTKSQENILELFILEGEIKKFPGFEATFFQEESLENVCCRSQGQAIYRLITGKNFVTVYTDFDKPLK